MTKKGTKGLVSGKVMSVDDAKPPKRALSPVRKSVLYLNTRLQASNRYRKESVVRPVFEMFMRDSRVGGPEGISSYMAETNQMAKDSRSFVFRHRWACFIRDLVKDFDETTKTSLEMELDPEELHLQMISGLLEMIRKDREFARAIVVEAAQTIKTGRGGRGRINALISAIEDVRDGCEVDEDIVLTAEDVVNAD